MTSPLKPPPSGPTWSSSDSSVPSVFDPEEVHEQEEPPEDE